jgi:hypothetical protein
LLSSNLYQVLLPLTDLFCPLSKRFSFGSFTSSCFFVCSSINDVFDRIFGAAGSSVKTCPARCFVAPHDRFHARNFQAISVHFLPGKRRALPRPRAAVRPLHNRNLALFCGRSATNETLERTQWSLILWCDETDRVANGVSASGPSDPMNIIF